MIRTLTAMTYEVDDAGAAISEILEALDLGQRLLSNAVGIICCHMEFIREGVAGQVADALPFPVLGMNTLGVAAGDEYEPVALGVCVLTSDDLVFKTGVSSPLNSHNIGDGIKDLYDGISEGGGSPSLIIVFAPVLADVMGDDYAKYMDEVSGGAAMFGSMAMDFDDWIRTPLTIYGNETYADRLCALFIYGDTGPAFSVTSLAENKILKQDAVVTEASGNILKGINGLPVMEYMLGTGLVTEAAAEDGKILGVGTMPFAMYPERGAQPIVRNVFGVTEEKYIVCGGEMLEGATLGIGSVEYEDVVQTSREAAERMMETGKRDGMIIFSCASRNVALDMSIDAEAKAVDDIIDGNAPYIFCYSGGEFCPMPDSSGKLKNRYHNNSIVFLTF